MRFNCIHIAIIFLLKSSLIFNSYGNDLNILKDTVQANYFFSKGDSLLHLSHFDSSIYYFEKAEEIYRTTQWSKKHVITLVKISESHRHQFHIDHAKLFSNKALKVAQSELSHYSEYEIKALFSLGDVHYLNTEFEDALAYYENALKKTQLVSNPKKRILMSSAYTSLGKVLQKQQKYEEAFHYYQLALHLNKEYLPVNHPNVADTYLNIGLSYLAKGNYSLAKDYITYTKDIYKTIYSINSMQVGDTYVALGNTLKHLGDFEKSTLYFKQAKKIYQTFLNEENPKLGDVHIGLADIAKNKSNYKKAINYYKKASAIYEKTTGKHNIGYIQANLGIANTHLFQENYLDALSYFNEVAEINFNIIGEHHHITSATYNNLGSLYYFVGDFELAMNYFKRALAIDKKLYGKKHPNVANIYYNMSRCYFEQGDTQKSLELLQEAIVSSIIGYNETSVYSNPHLVNFFDTHDLFNYLSFKGEIFEIGFGKEKNIKGLDVAVNSLLKTDSLVEKIKRSYVNKSQMVDLADNVREIYSRAINCTVLILENLSEDNIHLVTSNMDLEHMRRQYENLFFMFSEKNKGSSLFSTLAATNAKSFGDVPQELIQQEKILKKEISLYTQEMSSNIDTTLQQHYQTQLINLNEKYEKLLKTLETQYPKYYELKYDTRVVSIDDFQHFLSDSTLVISYHIGEKSYANYITKKTFDIYPMDINSSISKDILAFRKSIIYQHGELYKNYGHSLFKKMFPHKIPEGIKSIIIVTDGEIVNAPFEALLTSAITNQQIDYSQAPFLIKKYNVSYTYSANLLYKIFTETKTMPPKAIHAGLALAPVIFNDPYIKVLKNVKRKSYEEDDVSISQRKKVNLTTESLISLPQSQAEVEKISEIFNSKNKDNKVVIGKKATESFAKNNLYNYQYLHFATHGFVDQIEPEFSGLLFSTDSTEKEDGVLLTSEVYDLKLNSELITLSACQTGLGKYTDGEGVLGLARAFLYAGTKNLAVSLWKISDISTSLFMESFYNELLSNDVPTEKNKTLEYAHALKTAKLSLIGNPKYSEPYYWAPFVLIGK